MKKILLGLLVIGTTFFLTPATSSAHILKTDGNIGAILHILPDDNPVSGIPTTFELAFEDIEGEFSLPSCNCSLLVQEQNEIIKQQPLDNRKATLSVNEFIFPKAGVYTLTVHGEPKTKRTFQPFTITYTTRVSSGVHDEPSIPLLLWIGISGTLGIILLAAYAANMNYMQPTRKK